MIKINLLPREERIRRAPLNTRLILSGVAIGVVLLAMAYGWYWLNGEVGRLQAAIRQAQADIKRFEGLAKQVDTFRAEKKRLEDMINVIDTLVAAQGSPVQLLDEISKALPRSVGHVGKPVG